MSSNVAGLITRRFLSSCCRVFWERVDFVDLSRRSIGSNEVVLVSKFMYFIVESVFEGSGGGEECVTIDLGNKTSVGLSGMSSKYSYSSLLELGDASP